MAWEYSFNPATSPKDTLRFLIGDTDCKDPLLQDEECIYLLSLYNNNPLNAAIRACEVIMMKFSRLCNETVGSVSISFGDKYKNMMAVRADLIARLATEDCAPYAGGISVSDKRIAQRDCDRVQPDFTKHMDENRDIAPWVTNDPVDGGDYYRGA